MSSADDSSLPALRIVGHASVITPFALRASHASTRATVDTLIFVGGKFLDCQRNHKK